MKIANPAVEICQAPRSVLQATTPHRGCGGRRRAVRTIVTRQRTGARAPVIANRRGSVRAYNVQIEVYETLARHIRRSWTHSVRRVAHGAAESFVDVLGMVRPTGVVFDLSLQIVAFAADTMRRARLIVVGCRVIFRLCPAC